MFSKTLIVSLLAFLCLQICFADRLETRISGQFASSKGQFPYIAFVTYNYPGPNGLTSQQSTGIIYSKNSVITTANVFNNFPPGGADLVIEVAAFDINLPAQFFVIPNATVGTYVLPTDNTTVPPVPGNNRVLIPSLFVKGQSSYDVAVIRLNGTEEFNFTNPEISIANFPTSSPLPSDQLNAVAYGTQAPNTTAFPVLKYARLFLKRNNKCVKALTTSGVNTLFNPKQHFCIQSQAVNQTNGTFEGVCKNDIGGAVVRSSDITKPATYYEVIGLLSYTNDTTTCNAAARTPAIVIYLSWFQDKFFTPVLGSLSAVGNKQDPTKNPNSNQGNFICGNGVIDSSYEKCDPAVPADQPCCNPWICAWKRSGKKCGVGAELNATKDVCLTKKICDQIDGTCAARPRNQGKGCGGLKGTTCRDGKCKRCTSSSDGTETCTDI